MRLIDWTAADGTRIAARLYEPADPVGLPVVCLSGLTRNSRDFDRLAEALCAGGRLVLAMDYRGRGLSGYADAASYRPDVEAADLLTGLDRLDWPEVAMVGTSRGGIIAMIVAALAEHRLGPVVLNDVGPVLDLKGLLAIRDRMAAMIANPPADWDGAAAELRGIMGEKFTDLSDEDWHDVARQVYREDGGHPVLDYDPALLDTFARFDPSIGIEPLWPIYMAFGQRPVLALRGANSDLLTAEVLAEMQRRLPQLQTHVVENEGHAPLIRDQATIARIRTFFDETC